MSAVSIQQVVSGAAEDELTPDEIERLLEEATARLRSKQTSIKPKFHLPELDVSYAESSLLIKTTGNGLVSATIQGGHASQVAAEFRKVEDPVAAKVSSEEKRKATAGPMWHDLPKTDLTPELKRDLQMIKMRGILDPHRHYKKDNGKMKVPEYSMVGTIKEGATEFYSSRIENKKRKRTFVEQVLDEEQDNGRFGRKTRELQEKKSKGKKAFYKKLVGKRHKGYKGG